MGYIQFIEKELREWLDPKARDLRTPEEWVAWEEAIVELVKRWVLDSYRNGITAAKLVDADKEAERKTRTLARGKE